MKKLLLLALVCLLSNTALASGKLYLRANSFDTATDGEASLKYSLGLYMYEQLLPDNQLVFISFFGANLGGEWFKSDQSLQVTSGKIVYGGGIENLLRPDDQAQNQTNFYATVAYKLWE